VYDSPWIDKELLALLKKKNIQRKKSRKSKSPEAIAKFKQLRRESKIRIAKKKIEHANKMKNSVFENPKRFWSYVKSSTKSSKSPNFLGNGQSYITDSREKANLLNTFFHSVFNPNDIEPPASFPTPSNTLGNQLSEIELIEEEVAAVLSNLDPNKASGPDCIRCRLLKEVAHEIAPSLCRLFNLSLSLGVVPSEWKFANISPVFKKEDPSIESNYRPISLLCVLSKVLERCVFNHCYYHLSPLLYHLQHGFLRERSTVTQLLEVYHNIIETVASGREVDIIYLDLSKAFDKVPHSLLLASSLWSPYTIKHKRLVENVQRRTTKFILDYPQDLNYAARLAKIKILPLGFQRDISDLCLLFKSRTGAITTDVNKYICTFEQIYMYLVTSQEIMIKTTIIL
jgi:hypothetical protein